VLSRGLAQTIGRHGDVILRMKGLIVTEDDDRPLVLHSVQRLFHPPTRLTATRSFHVSSIVVIGDGRAAGAADEIREVMLEAMQH
jgi:G3E family GTPase